MQLEEGRKAMRNLLQLAAIQEKETEAIGDKNQRLEVNSSDKEANSGKPKISSAENGVKMIEDEQSEKGKEMQQSEMTEVEKEDVSGEQPPETAAMSGDSQPEEKLEVRKAEEQERKKEPEISEQKEGEEGGKEPEPLTVSTGARKRETEQEAGAAEERKEPEILLSREQSTEDSQEAGMQLEEEGDQRPAHHQVPMDALVE